MQIDEKNYRTTVGPRQAPLPAQTYHENAQARSRTCLVLHAQLDELLGTITSWHLGRVGIPVQHRLDLTLLRNCLAERIEVCRILRLEQRAGDVVI